MPWSRKLRSRRAPRSARSAADSDWMAPNSDSYGRRGRSGESSISSHAMEPVPYAKRSPTDYSAVGISPAAPAGATIRSGTPAS